MKDVQDSRESSVPSLRDRLNRPFEKDRFEPTSGDPIQVSSRAARSNNAHADLPLRFSLPSTNAPLKRGAPLAPMLIVRRFRSHSSNIEIAQALFHLRTKPLGVGSFSVCPFQSISNSGADSLLWHGTHAMRATIACMPFFSRTPQLARPVRKGGLSVSEWSCDGRNTERDNRPLLAPPKPVRSCGRDRQLRRDVRPMSQLGRCP